MPYPTDDHTSTSCRLDKHTLCSGCSCPCHVGMNVEYARALILRLAGERLWPDDPAEQRRLAEEATHADPFEPDLPAARRLLGLA